MGLSLRIAVVPVWVALQDDGIVRGMVENHIQHDFQFQQMSPFDQSGEIFQRAELGIDGENNQ